MAYRFNNGNGGVTCDDCNILYDANLSFKEYEEAYAKSRKANGEKDLCWKCKEKKGEKEGKVMDN